MNSSNEDTIDKLNHLIGLAADGKQGYESAAEDVDDPVMKSWFLRFSKQRAEYVMQLQRQVTALGGEADDDDGETMGALHRTWMDMKSVFTSGDTDAIINACITGEEAALEEYREALAEPYITGDVRALIKDQELGIQHALDNIQAHANAITE